MWLLDVYSRAASFNAHASPAVPRAGPFPLATRAVEFDHVDLAQLTDKQWMDYREHRRVQNMGNYYQIYRHVFGAKRKNDVSARRSLSACAVLL